MPQGKHKGDGARTGYFQKFVTSHGGKQFLQDLSTEAGIRGAVAMAEMIFQRYNELFAENTIRNEMKYYNIPRAKHGGDKQSGKYKIETECVY